MSLDNLFMDKMESDQQLLNDQCHPKNKDSAEYAQAETKRIQNQTQDEWLADYNKRDEEIKNGNV